MPILAGPNARGELNISRHASRQNNRLDLSQDLTALLLFMSIGAELKCGPVIGLADCFDEMHAGKSFASIQPCLTGYCCI